MPAEPLFAGSRAFWAWARSATVRSDHDRQKPLPSFRFDEHGGAKSLRFYRKLTRARDFPGPAEWRPHGPSGVDLSCGTTARAGTEGNDGFLIERDSQNCFSRGIIVGHRAFHPGVRRETIELGSVVRASRPRLLGPSRSPGVEALETTGGPPA